MTVRDEGMSLIEMLAVLAIIAVATGGALLSIAPLPGRDTRNEAARLARAITAAADATLVDAPSAVVTVAPDNYTVNGARHVLPGDLRFAEAATVEVESGATDPFDLTLAGDAGSWRVRFDGTHATAKRIEEVR